MVLMLTIGLIGATKPSADNNNRELLEYLMQASSHAFSQLPPGYLYNSAGEENQLELPVTSSSNVSVINDENDTLNTTYSTAYPSNNYLNSYPNVHQTNHQSNQMQPNQPQLNVSSRSVNLTRFLSSNDDDETMYLGQMNKQAKSSDFGPMHHFLPGGHLPMYGGGAGAHSKLYRMANGRREPFSARTVSSLFGRPRKLFPTAEVKSIDLMKSADIPTASASYYTTDGELDDPSQFVSAGLAKSAAMRSYPMYHQATNYGQYYAEDPRHYYHAQQMRDYYDPHGHDMSSYSKSDFYWLIPIAFLIGAGALLLPIISVFMTTLVTSGTLTLNAGRRRKRDVDFLVGEFKHLIGEDAYTKLEDLYLKVQKSLDEFGTKKTK